MMDNLKKEYIDGEFSPASKKNFSVSFLENDVTVDDVISGTYRSSNFFDTHVHVDGDKLTVKSNDFAIFDKHGDEITNRKELINAGYFKYKGITAPLAGTFVNKRGYIIIPNSFRYDKTLDVDDNGNIVIDWSPTYSASKASNGRWMTREYLNHPNSLYVNAMVGKNNHEISLKKNCTKFHVNEKISNINDKISLWLSKPIENCTRGQIGEMVSDILRVLEITDNSTVIVREYKKLKKKECIDAFNKYVSIVHKKYNKWYDGRRVSVVRDIDGNELLAHEAICIIDNKGHKKFFKSDGINTFDLAGLVSTYTTLNLENGGRKIAYDELDFLTVYINPHHKMKETEYMGQRIIYSGDDELKRVKKAIDITLKSREFENIDGKLVRRLQNLGGGNIRVPQPFTLARKSTSTLKTGKIGYSFGVEFETSMGDVHEDKCRLLGLSKQGDASIDGNEFVTRPLHGDHGIDMIRTYSDVLSQSVKVTNKDSIHVHVGGDNGIDIPIYNKFFSVNAVKLAHQIENELMAIVPQHRRISKYCKTVGSFLSEFTGLDTDDQLLYSYIFQRRGVFDRTWNRKRSDMSKWSNGRYKWLNLVNCNTINGMSRGQSFKTVEFRLWPGSVDFEEIKKYIQLSLAFVWFVENKPKRIREGDVSLGEVVDSSIRTSKESLELLEFIDNKKELYS